MFIYFVLNYIYIQYIYPIQPTLHTLKVLDVNGLDTQDRLLVVLEDEHQVEGLNAWHHTLEAGYLNLVQGQDEEGTLHDAHQRVQCRLQEDAGTVPIALEAELPIGLLE